jgi:hypothetical protein
MEPTHEIRAAFYSRLIFNGHLSLCNAPTLFEFASTLAAIGALDSDSLLAEDAADLIDSIRDDGWRESGFDSRIAV